MSMKTAVFWGCCIVTNQYGYELSVREVLPKFDVELVDLRETICCGDPIKSVSDFAASYLAVRVLALAHLSGQKNLLVPCNRCHFVLSEAKGLMAKNQKFKDRIIGFLQEEGLRYDPEIKIWHVIDFLHDHVGLSRIKKAVQKPMKGLRLASHTGCQILRYSDLGRVDGSENPKKLDELIRALGSESVEYAEKLDCCGAGLYNAHPDSAVSLAGSKLKTLQGLNVDGVVVSCPECALMFDSRQKDASATVGTKLHLPVIYYTQLLGLALNIPQTKLGLHLNQSPIDQLLSKVQA